MDFLFPLLKNSKSGVDDRGHRLRSGSPVKNLPGASPKKSNRKQIKSNQIIYFTFLTKFTRIKVTVYRVFIKY